MKASFSPSINIVRDSGRHLNYIPTANSHRIFDQITSEFRTGVRSFSIIGSYGTGKSAFLWALEKQLIGGQPYFGHLNGSFSGYKNFEFISIVGEYRSIIGAFARRLGIKSQFNAEKATLDKLSRHCAAQAKQGTCVVIIVDELGKFLEFAAKNVPEKELYFVQQLAEFCNDPSKNVLLITCLHQSFESYSNELNLTNRNEWEKVKGRLKELTFNEPIEQLLNLASEHLQKGERRSQLGAHLKDLTAAIKFSQCFALESSSFNLAHGLLPLDLLAAAVLALALQKYGQNERSLFSFLESNDYLGLRGFDSDVIPYYDLSCVYDYLIGNHYSFISTKENQHYVQWAAIRSSIERIEGTVENEPAAASRLVKAIGLLNIFARETARIDARFLSTYGKLAMGIDDTDSIINELERKKIIRFVRFKSRYILFEGTDFDIELALNVASGKVDQVNDITTSLNQYFVFPFVQAKGAHYKYGTPRLFEYRLTDRPYLEPLGAEVDGIVNLVFSDSADIEQIKTLSRSSKEAILYAIYRETKRIRELLWEIDKVKYTLSTVVDDRVARRELSNLLEDLIRQLNRTVLNDLYEEGKGTIWISGGRVLRIRNRTEFNRALSRICERVYTETPRYHNELINRNKLPGALVTARKKLMEAIILAWDKPDLGFENGKFPPEKTIYLSLLNRTGIHRNRNGLGSFGRPTDKSFLNLWARCESFLDAAKNSRKPISDLFEILGSKPFRLKRGFLETWIPIFLFIKKDDYALFGEQGYTPDLTGTVFDLILKNPSKFEIKSFNVAGVRLDLLNRYRAFLNKVPAARITNQSFIETIKPFLTFYKGLPDYAKHTNRLSVSARELRVAIATARDPEKSFFEDFPSALGFSIEGLRSDEKSLQKYIVQLQENIREIRTCFDELVGRIESHLIAELGYKNDTFPVYRHKILDRFSSLKKHLLLPHQRPIFQRLTSELDDRRAWICSVSQAALGSQLETLKDDEEERLLSRISHYVRELDNLCEMSVAGAGENEVEVFKFELVTLADGTQSRIVRLPKSKRTKVDRIRKEARLVLSEDKSANLSALFELMKEQCSDE